MRGLGVALAALAVALLCALGACTLNPQPLPPADPQPEDSAGNVPPGASADASDSPTMDTDAGVNHGDGGKDATDGGTGDGGSVDASDAG
jgi:hypothetical protein